MKNNTKKTENGVEVLNTVNISHKETVTRETEFSYNINAVTLESLKKRINKKIETVEKNDELTAEEKTAKIERLTVENELKSLVTMIENSLILMFILKNCGEKIEITAENNETFEINMDYKKLSGKTVIPDKLKLQRMIQDILLTGKTSTFNYIRGMKYVLETTEKSVICYTHVSMKNFNSFSRADKEKIKNSKQLSFNGVSIL